MPTYIKEEINGEDRGIPGGFDPDWPDALPWGNKPLGIDDALVSLYPNARWQFDELDYQKFITVPFTYEELIWKDEDISKPPKAELEAELVKLKSKDWIRKREWEYPVHKDMVVALAEKAEGDSTCGMR